MEYFLQLRGVAHLVNNSTSRCQNLDLKIANLCQNLYALSENHMHFRDQANSRSNVIPIGNTQTWESGGLIPAILTMTT